MFRRFLTEHCGIGGPSRRQPAVSQNAIPKAQSLDRLPPHRGRCRPAGIDSAQLETPAGEVTWEEPWGHLQQARRAFPPHKKALGLDVDQCLSSELLEKATCLETVLSSFPQAHVASERLLEQVLGIKRLQRSTSGSGLGDLRAVGDVGLAGRSGAGTGGIGVCVRKVGNYPVRVLVQ